MGGHTLNVASSRIFRIVSRPQMLERATIGQIRGKIWPQNDFFKQNVSHVDIVSIISGKYVIVIVMTQIAKELFKNNSSTITYI